MLSYPSDSLEAGFEPATSGSRRTPVLRSRITSRLPNLFSYGLPENRAAELGGVTFRSEEVPAIAAGSPDAELRSGDLVTAARYGNAMGAQRCSGSDLSVYLPLEGTDAQIAAAYGLSAASS